MVQFSSATHQRSPPPTRSIFSPPFTPATGCYIGYGLDKFGEGRPHPLGGRVGCKLDEDGGTPKYIFAEPRVGYRIGSRRWL